MKVMKNKCVTAEKKKEVRALLFEQIQVMQTLLFLKTQMRLILKNQNQIEPRFKWKKCSPKHCFNAK